MTSSNTKFTFKHCRQSIYDCVWSGKLDDCGYPTGRGQFTALKANKTVTYACVLRSGVVDGFYLEDLQGAYTTLACCNEQQQIGYSITYAMHIGTSRNLRLEHYNADGVQDKLQGMYVVIIILLSQASF
jgi:hypothetical protein